MSNSPNVTKKVLVFQKVAASCSLTKKLLKILKVAEKLPSRIWIGLVCGKEKYNARDHVLPHFQTSRREMNYDVQLLIANGMIF